MSTIARVAENIVSYCFDTLERRERIMTAAFSRVIPTSIPVRRRQRRPFGARYRTRHVGRDSGGLRNGHA